MNAQSMPDSAPAAAGELVLVVEDEDDIRTLVANILDSLNYRSITAADAIQAQEILQQQDIDILLTDIILPGGIDGRQLVKIALAEKPELRILYMSGYPVTASGEDISMPSEGNLLRKPFHPDEMAEALRQLAQD